ncbi:MAG: LuxR family transcriptional regulator, partial [Glaciimonas sp.]|nr:LuxR family transcriptional regulator [Glaciimonas sp.]
IPIHSLSVSERIGVLNIRVDLDEIVGEPRLQRHRIIYRALGMELLDWWISTLQQEANKPYQLQAFEIQLLRYSKKGNVPKQMAVRMHTSIGMMYRHIKVVKDKMRVKTIEDAVCIADAVGLLD